MSTAARRRRRPAPTEAQPSASRLDALTSLIKRWGADTRRTLDLANREIDRAEKAAPGLKAQLQRTGKGDQRFTSTIYCRAKAKGGA